ncbi:MAG: ribosomal methyltransferase RrmJ/FtsJ [Rickettsiales bacterium]|jgi:23S rRNA (uridine2552-2'-O)-methyltransferase|nr:ribosomal methyltransferase RrmJ/FtsJ [Rickettsiales bacterium]
MANRSGSGGNRPGGRQTFTTVKTAKGRKLSSTLWLERQLNDPYVARAKAEGYRSRAAYKLIEIDEKYPFLTKGKTVIDLGAAPGGWTQVAVQKIKAGEKGGGSVIGIDLQEVEAIADAELLQADFMEEEGLALLENMLKGRKVDIVLSDMAASSSGHTQTDHIRIIDLCEAAFLFACKWLSPGGTFVAKILQGGTEHTLLTGMKKSFRTVKHIKPPASRADSSEMYVICQGFRGEGK